MNPYFDTSAFVKLYHREEGTDRLMSFVRSRAPDLVISIAQITPVEFRSALWRRVRMEELAPGKVTQSLRKLERDIQRINVLATDESAVTHACRLLDDTAPERNVRALDALQLSTAVAGKAWNPIDVFIASDQRLLDVAPDHFPCWDPAGGPFEEESR